MTIALATRSPLGAVYRSPLGALGVLEITLVGLRIVERIRNQRWQRRVGQPPIEAGPFVLNSSVNFRFQVDLTVAPATAANIIQLLYRGSTSGATWDARVLNVDEANSSSANGVYYSTGADGVYADQSLWFSGSNLIDLVIQNSYPVPAFVVDEPWVGTNI